MTNIKTYIKEGLKIIKTLMKQGNFENALRGCKELLTVNPYDKKVQKQLQEILDLIIEKNAEKVDKDIDATMHLWEEEKYEELFTIYTKLHQFAPEHPRLLKLIKKLDQKLSQQQKNQRSDFSKKALSAISKLTEEKKYADAIQAYNELLNIDPMNEEAKDFLQKAKKALIDQKLEENAHIQDSADFQRALEFYESLLAIDPTHSQANRLSLQAKEHLAHQKLLASKIQLNESITRMKDLFKNAEHEKAIQACEEIDRLDPGNFTARVFKKKSEAAIADETETQTVKELKETWAKMENEYLKNPQAFLKI